MLNSRLHSRKWWFNRDKCWIQQKKKSTKRFKEAKTAVELLNSTLQQFNKQNKGQPHGGVRLCVFLAIACCLIMYSNVCCFLSVLTVIQASIIQCPYYSVSCGYYTTCPTERVQEIRWQSAHAFPILETLISLCILMNMAHWLLKVLRRISQSILHTQRFTHTYGFQFVTFEDTVVWCCLSFALLERAWSRISWRVVASRMKEWRIIWPLVNVCEWLGEIPRIWKQKVLTRNG